MNVRKRACSLYYSDYLQGIFLSPAAQQNNFLQEEKKYGAARLDPWEIFVLLALKIPFHFIS